MGEEEKHGHHGTIEDVLSPEQRKKLRWMGQQVDREKAQKNPSPNGPPSEEDLKELLKEVRSAPKTRHTKEKYKRST